MKALLNVATLAVLWAASIFILGITMRIAYAIFMAGWEML